jgi:integrase
LEEKNYTPKTIRTYVNSVQSLAQFFGFTISARYISLPTSQPVSKKYPWTLKEVGKFVGKLDGKELKSIAATVFQSGIGIGDIMLLTYGDIKREFESRVSPLCLEIARKKTDVPFYTFIGKWGLRLLRKHLKNNGRDLQDSEPIYSMSERTVQWHFKKLADAWLGDYEGNNPMRVHSLRSAFRTMLGDAGLNETYLEFFMGHRVPEHKRVYVSKSRDGWRDIYAKYEKFLDPTHKR